MRRRSCVCGGEPAASGDSGRMQKLGAKSGGVGSPSDADLAKILSAWQLRKWWNWQTHHLEGVAPKGVGVQIPPSAPNFETYYARLNPRAEPLGSTSYRD